MFDGGLAMSTNDDDFEVVTGGVAKNIVFQGGTTLVADDVSLRATGGITSGAAAADLNTDGDITLSAGGDIGGPSGNEFRYEPAGQLRVTGGGDIYLRQVGGDLLTNSFAILASSKDGGFVSIGTTDGAVNVNHTTVWGLGNDTLEIVTGGDVGDTHAITLNATLSAGAVRLTALGAIAGNAGDTTDIVTTLAQRHHAVWHEPRRGGHAAGGQQRGRRQARFDRQDRRRVH